MIDEVLLLLRDTMNDRLRSIDPSDAPDSTEPDLVLVDGEKLDPLTFKLGALSLLLVNVEADGTMRQANPFRRTLPDGTSVAVARELHLNLYVLFVARYRAYEQGLAKLSAVVDFFQSRPVLDRSNTPAMNSNIEKLQMELVTLPFGEQAEIWNGLRAAYHPSILYRVRMIRVEDSTPPPGQEITEIDTVVTQ